MNSPNDIDRSRDTALLAGTRWEQVKLFRDLLWTLCKAMLVMCRRSYEIFFPPKPKDIRGQLALVTGGAKGLGREISLELAKKGCNIAIVDIDLESGIKTADDLQNLGVKAKAFKGDVSNVNDVNNLKNEIEKHLGNVDILFNNAGVFFEKPLEEETPENLNRMMNINVMASMWMTRAFLSGMIERKKGHIAATSSFAGLVGLPMAICYTTTKFGLRGFMEGLCLDLHHRNLSDYIKTTCFFPYFMDTGAGIRNAVVGGSNHKVIFDPQVAAAHVVNRMLINEEIVTFPDHLYYMSYILYVIFIAKWMK